MTLHTFPSAFPPDTDYVRAALAEYNHEHQTALGYTELGPEGRREVLARAQQMKEASCKSNG